LGTEQSQDTLIYSDPENPAQFFGAHVTFDGNWVVMSITENTDPINKFWLAKLDNKSLPANGTAYKV
jgi:prolyl oligopeptidase